MLDRAQLLHRHGFTVLHFDFQSHGELGTKHHILLSESLDAEAALEYPRHVTAPGRIGGLLFGSGGRNSC